MRKSSFNVFVIEPENLFSNLKAKIENQTFEIEDLSNAIKNVENSTRGHESEDDYTPQQVSTILAKIVTDGKEDLRSV